MSPLYQIELPALKNQILEELKREVAFEHESGQSQYDPDDDE